MRNDRQPRANGYLLTVSLLVAVYVRHHDDDETQDTESSSFLRDDALPLAERKIVAQRSVHNLVQFLCDEIQQPVTALTEPIGSSQASGYIQEVLPATSLAAVLGRLRAAISKREDYETLADEVVTILAQLDSPDAVGDVVDGISECVAPLTRSAAGDALEPVGDSTSSLLVRRSLLGVFVRRFVLSVNRLLFDGISRLFDEVTQYRNVAMGGSIGVERGESREADEIAQPSSFTAAPSPPPRFLWKKDGSNTDQVMLSPIALFSSTSDTHTRPPVAEDASTQQAPCENRPDAAIALAKAAPVVIPDTISHDQQQFYMHDTAEMIERGRQSATIYTQPHSSTISSSGPLTSCSLNSNPADRSVANPDVLFVRYLDFVNRRQYDDALETLHQYHDFALSSGRRRARGGTSHSSRTTDSTSATPGTATGASRSGTTSRSGAASGDSGDRGRSMKRGRYHFVGSGVQYAALNLAGFHIMFDRFEAAQDSIHEAIRVAQHHGDHVCVAFALSWLIRVLQSQGHARGHVAGLVAHTMERANELALPSLRALAALAGLEYDVGSGQSTAVSSVLSQFPSPRPLELWHQLEVVDRAIVQLGESIPSATSGGGSSGAVNGLAAGRAAQMQQQQQRQQQAGATSSTSRKNSTNTRGMQWKQSVDEVLQSLWSLQGKSRLASALSWRVFGNRTLEKSFDDMFWGAYRRSASIAETASWISRAIQSRGEWAENDNNDQMECPAPAPASAIHLLQKLVTRFHDQDTIAPQCDETLLFMGHRVLQRAIHQVLFTWALNRGEYLRADVHVHQLIALSPISSEFPMHLAALMARAQLWAEQEHFEPSFSSLDEIEEVCKDRGDDYLLVQVLLLQSTYQHRATSSHGAFAAFPIVLRAIDLASRRGYDILLAEAHVLMADMYVGMGKTTDATDLLAQQMGTVMEHGSIRLRAESFLILAKAALASGEDDEAGCEQNGDGYTNNDDEDYEIFTGPVRLGRLRHALALLRRSESLWGKLQCLPKLREVAFLQSIVHRHLSGASSDGDTAAAAKLCLHYGKCLRDASTRRFELFFSTDSPAQLERVVQSRLEEYGRAS